MNVDMPAPKLVKPVTKSGFHHGDLYNSAIYAVAQLIKESKGLGFQLKDVAKLVGTSQPALYKHFANRKALLVETAVEGYRLQNELRDHALKQTTNSPLSTIMAIALSYIYFSRTYPGFFLLIKNLMPEDILSSKRYLMERGVATELIMTTIARSVDDGLVEDIDPQLVGTLMNSTVYGLAHQYLIRQNEVLAPDHVDDPLFPEQIIRKSLEAFLTVKGKRELKKLPLAKLLAF